MARRSPARRRFPGKNIGPRPAGTGRRRHSPQSGFTLRRLGSDIKGEGRKQAENDGEIGCHGLNRRIHRRIRMRREDRATGSW